MWPIKERENRHLLIQWPNLIPYNKLQKCVASVLLSTSTSLIRSTSTIVNHIIHSFHLSFHLLYFLSMCGSNQLEKLLRYLPCRTLLEINDLKMTHQKKYFKNQLPIKKTRWVRPARHSQTLEKPFEVNLLPGLQSTLNIGVSNDVAA